MTNVELSNSIGNGEKGFLEFADLKVLKEGSGVLSLGNMGFRDSTDISDFSGGMKINGIH